MQSATAARSARCSGASPDINADLGDADTAAAQFDESLTLFVEFGDRWFCGAVLESAASSPPRSGDTERAVRLLGAADAVLGTSVCRCWHGFVTRHDRVLDEARDALGESRFAAAWDEGKRLPLGATVELVEAARRTRVEAEMSDGLTTREIDVLALVADGRTDAEVAETLVVSIRTVHAHLRSIYRKTRGPHAKRRDALRARARPRRVAPAVEVRYRG